MHLAQMNVGTILYETDDPTPYAFTFRSVSPPVDLKPEPYCVGWA